MMKIRCLSKKLRNEKGAVMVISAFAVSSMLAVMALSLDTGYVFLVQTELQNAADAAALAAVTSIPVTEDEARQISIDFASQFYAGGKTVALNPEDAKAGRFDFTTNQFVNGALPVNAAFVTAARDNTVTAGRLALFFAKTLGISDVNLKQSAVAAADPRVVGVMAGNHLIPYTMDEALADQDGDGNFDVGAQVDIYIHNASDKGNFGFLNLDGGDLSTTELRQFILYGFNQDFSVPPSGFIPITGDTGIRGQSLFNAFEQVYYDFDLMQGLVLYMPVHRAWSGQGSNAVFEIVDIVAVRLRQVQINGNIHGRQIRVEIVPNVSSGLIVREGAPNHSTLLKLRLVE